MGAADDGGYGCGMVVCCWVCVVGLWVMGLWWLFVAFEFWAWKLLVVWWLLGFVIPVVANKIVELRRERDTQEE